MQSDPSSTKSLGSLISSKLSVLWDLLALNPILSLFCYKSLCKSSLESWLTMSSSGIGQRVPLSKRDPRPDIYKVVADFVFLF
jgi:hypothetical protein